MTSAAADRFMWKSPHPLSLKGLHLCVSEFFPLSSFYAKSTLRFSACLSKRIRSFRTSSRKCIIPFFATAGSVFCYFPDIWYCKLHKQGAWEINKFLDLPAWRKGLQLSIRVSLSNSSTFSSHALQSLQFANCREFVWKTAQSDKERLWDYFA